MAARQGGPGPGLDTQSIVAYDRGMTVVTDGIDRVEQIELRQQAHYWQAQHARAVQREAQWKATAGERQTEIRQLHATIAQLRQEHAQQEAEIQQKQKVIETLKAKVVELTRQVFGRKTEATSDSASTGHDPVSSTTEGDSADPAGDDSSDKPASDEPRGRGQQEGTQGHGRQCHEHLPSVEQIHELPDSERCCPACGKPFGHFAGTEDSQEIEWEVILRRRIHKRRRYQPTCDCQAVPGIVTAPPAAKLIGKGKFAISFWVRLLLEKFLFQRPLYRILKLLSLEGLDVSPGTITGGLQRLGELLQPVYTRILERNREAHHWKMDETRWMVFEQREGKVGYRWWLWVVITVDTVVYLLEPTRSAKVPHHHLGSDPQGIINADRYAAYTALGDKIQVAFCWSHLRRDFDRVQNGYPALREWGQQWMTRINETFHLNRERLKVRHHPEAFEVADQALRQALEVMTQVRARELANPDLHPAARKVLESMHKRWSGYMIFVDRPEIPMDNNESERRLRNPVVGRKNYYGSGSQWSAMLTAILFTLFQTLLKNQINPSQWLFAYFQACAQNGGRAPEDLDSFLPWNLSPQKKAAWHYPERPP